MMGSREARDARSSDGDCLGRSMLHARSSLRAAKSPRVQSGVNSRTRLVLATYAAWSFGRLHIRPNSSTLPL